MLDSNRGNHGHDPNGLSWRLELMGKRRPRWELLWFALPFWGFPAISRETTTFSKKDRFLLSFLSPAIFFHPLILFADRHRWRNDAVRKRLPFCLGRGLGGLPSYNQRGIRPWVTPPAHVGWKNVSGILRVNRPTPPWIRIVWVPSCVFDPVCNFIPNLFSSHLGKIGAMLAGIFIGIVQRFYGCQGCLLVDLPNWSVASIFIRNRSGLSHCR